MIEDQSKHDIRKILKQKFKTVRRSVAIKEANITTNKMSNFICERGGLQFHDGIRLLITLGYKISDERGNVILGNPNNKAEELAGNSLDIKFTY
jgi:hypothetical protein